MRFNMNYNTATTFDFDSKNLKLAYEGKEDEIIKNLEAGNVSMTTGSSLIHGSAALFGVKTKLQFGKLTATALVSQQNSESQTVSSRGGSQTTEFYMTRTETTSCRIFSETIMTDGVLNCLLSHLVFRLSVSKCGSPTSATTITNHATSWRLWTWVRVMNAISATTIGLEMMVLLLQTRPITC